MPPTGGEGRSLFDGDRGKGLPGPLVLLMGLAATVALVTGGWPLVVVPVLILSALRRRHG